MSEYTELSDEQLATLIQKQDQTALNELYQRYAGLVYGFALKTLKNQQIAEEITQDIFMFLWDQIERWNPARGKLSTWLLTITRNKSVDRIRSESRKTPDTQIQYDEMEDQLFAKIDAEFQDNRRLLRELLNQLPRDQMVALELVFFQGLTHSELAEQLGEPLGTVKGRVRLGLNKLRSLWKQET